MKRFTDWIMMEVEKEKRRLEAILENIIVTQITRDKTELKILQHLLQGEYELLICKQVGSIAKKLFSFVPKTVSPGYKRFHEYIDKRNG